MKTLLTLAALVLFVGTVSADSPLYEKSLPIAKITASAQGYKVIYLNAAGDPHTIYVPLDWFYQGSGFSTDDGFTKAELDLGTDPSYPYIQFYWKNGAFHHLKIYARSDKSDSTWGSVRTGDSVADKFDPTKPLDLKF